MRTFDRNHLLISPALKIRFVYVPKCACTAWKYLLHRSEGGNVENLSDVHIKSKCNYICLQNSNESILNEYSSLPIYCMIRDPTSRLISSFINKFINYDKSNQQQDWWQNVRNSLAEYTKSDQYNFNDFVKWITIDKSKNIYARNEHWLPFSDIIGDINQYNYVFLCEDLSKNHIIDSYPERLGNLIKLLPPPSVSAPHANKGNIQPILSIESKELIQHYYADDIKVFNKVKLSSTCHN